MEKAGSGVLRLAGLADDVKRAAVLVGERVVEWQQQGGASSPLNAFSASRSVLALHS